MTNISFVLFPEYKLVISRNSIKKCLDLVESIVNYSQGRNLDKRTIEQIKEKLKSRLEGIRLYKGGSSVIFGYGYQFEKVGPVIIKPYYKRDLIQLIIHYLTLEDSKRHFNDKLLESDDKTFFQVAIPDLIGIAQIETYSRVFPTLIVKEIIGDSILQHPYLIKYISNFSRDLALNGVICDPYASNWILETLKSEKTIYYIDLLSSNCLQNVNQRISDLIKQLE